MIRPGAGPASLVGTFGPGRLRENRALTVSLLAVSWVQLFASALLVAHRRQREAGPSPGLTARLEGRAESPDAEGSPRGPSKPR